MDVSANKTSSSQPIFSEANKTEATRLSEGNEEYNVEPGVSNDGVIVSLSEKGQALSLSDTTKPAEDTIEPVDDTIESADDTIEPADDTVTRQAYDGGENGGGNRPP